MSYESDRKLSLEELKQRNKSVPSSPPPTANPCPLTQQDLDELFEMLLTMQEQMKVLQQQGHSLKTQVSSLPIQAQMEQMGKSLSQIQQSLSQAGKKKGRSFSLPKLRLPQINWTVLLWILISLLPLAVILSALAGLLSLLLNPLL